MKKIVFCLYLMVMVFSIFILSNTAFATNWVYVTKNSLWGMTTSYYVDADSVIKNNSTIIYWVLAVNDTPDPAMGVKRYIEKVEALPQDPRKTRTLEQHEYGAKGEIIIEYPTSDETRNGKFFLVFVKGSPLDMEIDVALKYAKEGKDDGQIPTLP
jgi:hypothetical protein